MASAAPVNSKSLALFFTVTGLFHLLAMVARFPEFAQTLPLGLETAVLAAHLPLLLVEGYFEGRMGTGPIVGDMPLWMRIRSKPMMFSFTFAFVYLSVVIFQTWDIKLGSVAFSADSGSVSQRATWFATFTVGFAFIHYMAAGRILIPILRIITAPFRILPTLLAVPVLVALGAAGAFFGFEHIPSETIAGKVAQWKTMMAADAGLTTMVVLATVGLPILFGILGGMLIGKKSDTG